MHVQYIYIYYMDIYIIYMYTVHVHYNSTVVISFQSNEAAFLTCHQWRPWKGVCFISLDWVLAVYI